MYKKLEAKYERLFGEYDLLFSIMSNNTQHSQYLEELCRTFYKYGTTQYSKAHGLMFTLKCANEALAAQQERIMNEMIPLHTKLERRKKICVFFGWGPSTDFPED